MYLKRYHDIGISRRGPGGFIDYVLEKLPFSVDVIQTDNGPEFGSRFHHHVLDVERSNRIDAEEFYLMLDGVVIGDTKLFNDKLQGWENFYNFDLPHGALGGKTPNERLREKTTGSM